MTGLCIIPLVLSIVLLALAHYVLEKNIEFQKEGGDYLLVFSGIICAFIILLMFTYAYLLSSGPSLTFQDQENFDALYYIVCLAMIG